MTDQLANDIIAASQQLAEAVRAEMTLEDNRHTVKMAAITRIMGAGDNPLTGKPHSFSSADAAVHSDQQYAEYLEQLRDAVYNRILVRGRYEAALARARVSTHEPA